MTKETILETNVKRETGYLYFCGTSDDGCLTIGRTKMARGRKKGSTNE